MGLEPESILFLRIASEAFVPGSSSSCSVPAGTPGWWLSLYPSAGEAGGSFTYQLRPPRLYVPGTPARDPERSRLEAARRARARLRRYCAANRLNRLGTLTYAGEGCHDPRQLRTDVGRFFRQLRAGLGGKALPYAWVPEWHHTDHGQHVHFAVGRYVPRSLIEQSWGLGFVHIKLLGDLPVGSGRLEEARKAAGYLSKYVAKTFDQAQIPGLHRFDVAEGFQPEKVRVYGTTSDTAVERASDVMGAVPKLWWRSSEALGWQGPPAVWVSWAG